MTREQAIAAAGACLAPAYLALYGVDGTSVAEAARRAQRPGGPPVEVLEQCIRDLRASLTSEEATPAA